MSESTDTPTIPDDDACAEAIGRIGAIAAELKRLEADKEKAVAAAVKRHEDQAGPLIGERAGLAAAVEAYCGEHRARLTGGTSKTAAFPTGQVQWRKARDRIEIDDARVKEIVAAIRKLGRSFVRFVRVKEEPSKTAIAAATDAEKARLKRIRGLAFVAGGETFAVEPLEAPIAERHPQQEQAA